MDVGPSSRLDLTNMMGMDLFDVQYVIAMLN